MLRKILYLLLILVMKLWVQLIIPNHQPASVIDINDNTLVAKGLNSVKTQFLGSRVAF